MNQQPPVHQFRMRTFKSFWYEPKTHPLSLPTDFSAPFSTTKFSLLPTSSHPISLLHTSPSPLLPPSSHFLFIPSLELGRAPELE